MPMCGGVELETANVVDDHFTLFTVVVISYL